ncbi:hypothetical protein B0H66DRAFT_564392 [Apodospora peruviana]|uniref:Uncharacterized protein n=1 Tax=Apodospora peruviana TaxID=516989 RepID=A0AAE0M0V0_9PEZI|nr:hypothetical protein B0H66DRAFT_564392 [Apodospora peruviana]
MYGRRLFFSFGAVKMVLSIGAEWFCSYLPYLRYIWRSKETLAGRVYKVPKLNGLGVPAKGKLHGRRSIYT